MKKTRAYLRIFALLLAFALLSGCGGPEGAPANRKPAEETAQPTDETVQETTLPTAGGEDSGSFGLAYYKDAGFNPFTCTKLANRAIMSLLYQRLFVVTADYQADPQLCGDYSHSDDLKTWTFHLKSAKFTDGTSLTADDVVASLEAARDSAVYGSRLHHVLEIAAEGRDTVILTMDTAYEMVPMLLDIPIVRAKDVGSARPIGSGSYALRGFGSSLSLEWKQSDGTDLLTQKNIPLYPAESTTDVRDSFEFYGTSLAYTDPGSASYADYRSDYELYECPASILLYVGCNPEAGIFKDPEVRKAVTYAIDRETLAQTPYNGFAKPATLPADPDSLFYDKTLAGQYVYNPRKFSDVIRNKALVGSEISILVDGSRPYRIQAAETIAKELQAAGLVVTVNTLTGNSYEAALIAWNYDLHLGEAKLPSNYDLTEFFHPWGSLSLGGMANSDLYAACLDALENSGNYYNFHRAIAQDGRLWAVLVRSYAVYVDRGSLPDVSPGIDCVFHRQMAVPEEE